MDSAILERLLGGNRVSATIVRTSSSDCLLFLLANRNPVSVVTNS